MAKNEFEKEEKYRLFRTVQEILHPSISKKNISDYEIIVEENILPIRVFYPKRVSYFCSVMIFIHGNGKVTHCSQKYANICKDLSTESNSLVMALEYEEEPHNATKTYQEIYKTVKYLYERLEKNDVDPRNILLVGDSTGGNIVTGINYQNNGEIPIQKEILFYPTLHTDYPNGNTLSTKLQNYYEEFLSKEEKNSPLFNPLENTLDIPETLLIVGKIDPLLEEAKFYQEKYSEKVHYVEIPFSGHGFLEKMDTELIREVFEEINQFIEI